MGKLSSEEKRLLVSVLNADNEDTPWIEEALKQLHGAWTYLARKYPGQEFVSYAFEPLTKISEKGILMASRKGSSDAGRVVFRYDDGGYVYEDNLYTSFVRENYDAQLEATIRYILPEAKAYTCFYTPADETIGMDCSAEAVKAYRPLLIRHTDLYSNQNGAWSDALHDALSRGQYYGSYTLWKKKDDAYCIGGEYQVFASEQEGETE